MCFHQRAVNKKQTNKPLFSLNTKSGKTASEIRQKAFHFLENSAGLQAQKPSLLKILICSPLLDLMSMVSFPSTQNMAYKHTLGRTREADFIKPEAFLSLWMCCPAHPPRAYLALKWLPCWSKDLIGSTHCFSL